MLPNTGEVLDNSGQNWADDFDDELSREKPHAEFENLVCHGYQKGTANRI